MNIVRHFVLLSIVTLGLTSIPGQVEAALPLDASTQCKALGTFDFSQVPDAVTQVIETKSVDSVTSESGSAYCEVSGYVAPSVGFLLRLPAKNWNGKFMEIGCGAACGTTAYVAACDDPLHRGYACIVDDGGHKSTGLDMKWAYNNPQSVMDYLVRASHVTALAGKAIAGRYYKRGPEKSYFEGCSAGGEQAMSEAQRFPWDFDGIIAGSPDTHRSEGLIDKLWANRVLMDDTGKLLVNQADLELLHRAVVSKCDLNDGVKDGAIGDPRACGFDPAELRCTAESKGQCLTPRQIEAVRKVYDGPVTSKESVTARTDWPGN